MEQGYKKIIFLFVSIVVSFMSNFLVASSCNLRNKVRENGKDVFTNSSTVIFWKLLHNLVLLFVFHLGCSFSFMDLNHPCMWIYENSASQRMQKESAVLFWGAGGGAPLETLLNSFSLSPWALAIFQDVVQDQCAVEVNSKGKTLLDLTTDCVTVKC